MGIVDKILDFNIRDFVTAEKPVKKVEALRTGGVYNEIVNWSFDGEKNLGGVGQMKDYTLDFNALRVRSWQSFLESELTQTIINKYTVWVVGNRLKLQSEPNQDALETESISFDMNELTTRLESRWSVYSNSNYSTHSGNCNLNRLSRTAFKNSKLGGDVLVILRVVNNIVNVQLIDGQCVQTPLVSQSQTVKGKKEGATIRNGVEIDKTGKHIAYWVNQGNYNFKRVEAYGKKSGKKMAYLVIGSEYRIDNLRGMPLISTSLETLAKLDRYKEAMVAGAESRAKIAYSIEHGIQSTGENPFTQNAVIASDYQENSNLPVTEDGYSLNTRVTSSVENTTINMPNDSKLVMHESKQELAFSDFYTINVQHICAALGIPYEVAMSMFNSNYSASRAALKDWEHSLNVQRKDFSEQFLSPIYDLFFDIQIMTNKVNAPGYLIGDDFIKEAYKQHRFIGMGVPHIDPLKEVKAEREKLGELGKNLPLTTLERAVETLNTGDSSQNIKKFSDELRKANELGLIEQKEVQEETDIEDVETDS